MTILKNEKEDTIKVNCFNALSEKFLSVRNDSLAAKYATDASALAEKKGFKKGLASANVNLGNAYRFRGNDRYYEGNFAEALKNYLTALTFFEMSDNKKGVASIRRNIGLVYWKQNDYAEALNNHFLALALWKEVGDKNAIAASYNDIGNAYENQGSYDEALKQYLLSLKTYEEAGNREAMINRYFNIAFLFEDQGNYEEALKNHFAALKLSKEIGSTEAIASCLTNIAGLYENLGKKEPNTELKQPFFQEALNNYLLALEKYKETGDKEGLAACYVGLGGLYFEINNFINAKKYLESGLALFKNVEANEEERYQMPAAYIRDNYHMLAKTDSAMGNWKEALQHHQLYAIYRDSVTNDETASKIIKTQMQYDFDKKEDSMRYQQALTKEKLKEQKQAKNYLFVALALVIALFFFIYMNYRSRQQLKLQVLRNKIATDLHDDIGSTLSSISIFSQMVQQRSKVTDPLLETIGDNSRKMLDAMADIVWTINPENDQFEKIVLRMKNFAYELLGARNIDFEFNADEDITKTKLSMDVRKNLYLIFKEATNNLVKYSEANKAVINIKEEKNNLIMSIRDNGKGFDKQQSRVGNGLMNMKKRAEEIGAHFIIDSKPGHGTNIEIKLGI